MDTSVKTETQLAQLDRALDAGTLADVAGIVGDLSPGDAAHLNPPSGGMGMNGGIHDAMNLCSKLLRVIDGADPALLDRYHRQRHTIVSQRIIPQASANRGRMGRLTTIRLTH